MLISLGGSGTQEGVVIEVVGRHAAPQLLAGVDDPARGRTVRYVVECDDGLRQLCVAADMLVVAR